MKKVLLLMLLCFFTAKLSLLAQLDTRPLIEDVGVEEQAGDMLDLSLTFTDRTGTEVTLAQLIKEGKPVIFAPVYYDCPSLCTLILDGIRDLINELDLVIGTDYRIINVCFNPDNTPELAAAKAENYAATLHDRRMAEHWYYLTGGEANISTFMTAIGFRYKKIEDLYSHSPVLVVASPEGKITRYIYGVDYDPKTVRMSLVEAAQGKVGSPLDKILMYCFKYDPLAGKYVPYAWRIMRIGAGACLLTLFILIGVLWKAELNRKRRLEHNV